MINLSARRRQRIFPLKMLTVGLLSVIGSIVISPPYGLSGWEIEVKHSVPSWGGGTVFTMPERRVFQGNQGKTEHFDENAKNTTTIIVDLGAERMTVVRHWNREYFTGTFREMTEHDRARQAWSKANAEKVRRENLDKLPAPDREKFDKARKQTAETARAELCRDRWEVKRTDQRETIAGYDSIRHETLRDGRPLAQTWLTKDLDPLREIARSIRNRLAALTPAKGLPFLSRPPFEGCRAGEPGAEADPSWKLLDDGYVMREEALGGTSEVVRVRQREFPASEFLPPSGFTRKPLRDF